MIKNLENKGAQFNAIISLLAYPNDVDPEFINTVEGWLTSSSQNSGHILTDKTLSKLIFLDLIQHPNDYIQEILETPKKRENWQKFRKIILNYLRKNPNRGASILGLATGKKEYFDGVDYVELEGKFYKAMVVKGARIYTTAQHSELSLNNSTLKTVRGQAALLFMDGHSNNLLEIDSKYSDIDPEAWSSLASLAAKFGLSIQDSYEEDVLFPNEKQICTITVKFKKNTPSSILHLKFDAAAGTRKDARSIAAAEAVSDITERNLSEIDQKPSWLRDLV